MLKKPEGQQVISPIRTGIVICWVIGYVMWGCISTAFILADVLSTTAQTSDKYYAGAGLLALSLVIFAAVTASCVGITNSYWHKGARR